MKAVVVHQYGGPEVLKFEDYPDAACRVNEGFLSPPLPGLCVVNAAILAKIPKGLDLIQAALPQVTMTGNQLLSATGIKVGQMVMVVGAVGNVGRSAVFTAKEGGATVMF
jgi:NADPH:quinone reductase-like Zn-dependent oxidoreductase